MKKSLLFIPILLGALSMTAFASTECNSGYTFNPRSGVGCQQTNCSSIPSAHYSYTGHCICGSSGSINENPDDPNKACYYPNDYTACPSCVYACVHTSEPCPDEQIQNQPNRNTGSTEANDNIPDPDTGNEISSGNLGTNQTNINTQASNNENQQTSAQQTTTQASAQTTIATANTGRTCESECARLKRGGQWDEVLLAEGIYPNCNCIVDIKDKHNRVTQTVKLNGDSRTTYIYDPITGELIKRETISLSAERERIRQALGFKYDEEQIRQMLDPDKITSWFQNTVSHIETNPNIMTPAFWWQHMVALWDHGYGNSADFVDIYNFGRCGDSMEWLERRLASEMKLTGKFDKTSEIMLSITGEKYNNILNHTALIIRPVNYSNIEWAEIVTELTEKTRAGGLTLRDISQLDPALLDAKVIDPYRKQTVTVREFIKGWSVIKIS